MGDRKLLEEAYPDRLSLFGGSAGHAMARFFNSWADIVLIPGIASFVAADILRHLDPRDRDYFRQTREKRFGISMDDFAPAAKRASQVSGKAWSLCVRRSKRNRSRRRDAALPRLHCVRWLSMGQSNQPVRIARKRRPIAKWRERMLDAFDGLSRNPLLTENT